MSTSSQVYKFSLDIINGWRKNGIPRVPMALLTQCSGCSGKFSWSVAESAQQLFPLLCGEIFCRACLGRKAREALSRRIVPLQCCERVVPHDFVRMVLAYEEDVFYSYLLNQPRDEAESDKLPAVREVVAKIPALPPPKKTIAAAATSDDTETKQPAQLAQNTAAAVAASPVVQTDAATVPIRGLRVRYRTRGSKARQGDPTQSAKAVGIASEKVPASEKLPVASSCYLCGTWMSAPQIEAPCGHALCQPCVETSVRRYLDAPPDNTRAPASCCDQVLPLHLLQRVISRADLTKYAKLMNKATATSPAANNQGTKRKAEPGNASHDKSTKGKARAAPPAKRRKSTTMKQVNDQNQVSKRECSACLLPVTLRAKWLVGPCGHGYCRSCLLMMAKTSLANRDQVPIRCCSKEFPIEYVKQVLTKAQFGQYERFLAERDPSSSTLQSDKDYAKVVRQVQGKQCPTCGIGVVKTAGCHAMQCSLGHVFCWNCLHTRCTCGKIYRYD